MVIMILKAIYEQIEKLIKANDQEILAIGDQGIYHVSLQSDELSEIRVVGAEFEGVPLEGHYFSHTATIQNGEIQFFAGETRDIILIGKMTLQN